MVGAVAVSHLDSLMGVVLCQAVRVDRWIYLGSRYPAPPAYGSVDELRLEVYVADGTRGRGFGRSMAFSGPGRHAVAGQHSVYCSGLRAVGARRGDKKQDRKANLSFC